VLQKFIGCRWTDSRQNWRTNYDLSTCQKPQDCYRLGYCLGYLVGELVQSQPDT